ncbi:MAG: hypothetical protein PWP49_541 [Thermococcaceae archaeon]|jgi:hypothetical protein|nr:hypothetical protein [Thermococcaceae archaeon]
MTGSRKRWLKIAYFVIVALLLLSAFVFTSVYFASQGIQLPWVQILGETYSVHPIIALLFATILAGVFTVLMDKIAAKKGAHYYYYGLVVVIISVALLILVLYGSACGACKALVCQYVQECSIEWQNIFKVIVRCVCK